jgi:hypothetical protein
MTHDELLARLDGQIESSKVIGCKCPACDNAVALRAVVELHKPIISTAFPEFLGICLTCSPPSLNFYEATHYPCPTIQAIEKELG